VIVFSAHADKRGDHTIPFLFLKHKLPITNCLIQLMKCSLCLTFLTIILTIQALRISTSKGCQ